MLERDDVIWAIAEIASRLEDSEIHVTLSLIGGAAMVLQHDPERGSTGDVDTWIEGSKEAREALERLVREIAVERGWPSDWLNDRAARNAFIPEAVEADDFTILIEETHLTVRVAEARLMFVMKLRAARGRRDFDDLDVLVEQCAIASRDEAVELFENAYPEPVLEDAADRWLDGKFTANGSEED
jgi:hypothetical protein